VGKALRRKTFIRSPRVFWWGLACWVVIGVLLALVVAGFVFILLVVAS
jgi:uncharacterized membrane protein